MNDNTDALTTTERLTLAITQTLRRCHVTLDDAHGLKTVKVLVRISKQGRINEVVLTPETSTAWLCNENR